MTKTLTGDIEGESSTEYLMMYRSDGSAAFVGLERVIGRVAGKAGSFVLKYELDYAEVIALGPRLARITTTRSGVMTALRL